MKRFLMTLIGIALLLGVLPNGFATMMVFPSDVQKSFYKPSDVILKGKIKIINYMLPDFLQEEEKREEFSKLESYLYVDQSISDYDFSYSKPAFLLLEVKVLEIIKQEYGFKVFKGDLIEKGDIVPFVYLLGPGQETNVAKLLEGKEFFFFLKSRQQYDVKQLVYYFSFFSGFPEIQGTETKKWEVERWKNKFFFSGCGSHMFVPFKKDSEFAVTLDVVSKLENMETVEDKENLLQDTLSKYPDNVFLQKVRP